MDWTLAQSSAAEWASALMTGLTAVIAIPAAALFLLDRYAAGQRRLAFEVRKDAQTYVLNVTFRSDDFTRAIDATVEVLGKTDARISTNSAEPFSDGYGQVVYSKPLSPGRKATVRMIHHRGSPSAAVGRFFVWTDAPLSSLNLSVTVSTWPMAKRLIHRKQTISPTA
jgi:hypothetical protein